MTKQTTIVERIVKLLAKAERASTPEEAEAFFAKAAELQAQHSVDEMMLDAARGAAAGRERDVIGSKRYVLTGSYRKAHQHVIYRLATALGGKAIELMDWDSKTITMLVHGFESDLTVFEVLYASLLVQSTRACTQHVAGLDSYSYMTAAEKFQERKSFIMGYGTGAARKVADARRAAVQEKAKTTTGVELVLVDRKSQVDRHYNELYPSTKSVRGTKMTSAGFSAGCEAGRNADVGGSRLGGGSSRSLGS